MDHEPETKRIPKRKLKQPQSPLACETCRAKKVRCDLTERRTQCSRCENNGTKCNIVPGKRRHLVQRILGSGARPSTSTNSSSCSSDLLPSTTGYGYVSAGTPSTSDPTSPSSASEGANSPFSIMSASSSASRASSFDIGDLQFLNQFDKSSDDVSLPSYIKPLPGHLARSTIVDLRRAGCFDLPSIEARRSMVDTYRDWVHPTLPLIDAAQLRSLGNAGGESISLLLFKAIDLVACVHGSRDIVSANTLAYQVGALLRANAEKDPLAVLQALILTSFSDGDPSGSRDGYYWIGLANTYATRLIRVCPALSAPLQRALWCLAWRGSVVALASRKPRQVAAEISISVSSYMVYDLRADQAALSEANTPDANESDDVQSDVDHWDSLFELSEAIQATANLKLDHSGSSSASEATHLLRRWYVDWHEPLRGGADSPRDVVRNSILLSYWSLAVLNLHCRSPRLATATSPVHDYSLVTAALSCITAVCVGVIERNLIHHLPAAAVAALAPAAVAYLTNSTSQENEVRFSNSQKYYQCWQILRELRSKYHTAHQAMLMLDSLGQRIRQGFDTEEAEHVTRLRLWCATSPVSV